jgi:hypothetical protein
MNTFNKKLGFVAILDTMWGTAGAAQKWFLINPTNASGRRLYKLTGSRYGNLAVVNACPQQTDHATKHGKPSVEWLAASLGSLPTHFTRRGVPLLVCGAVAQETFTAMDIKWNGPVIFMDHPAARRWSKEKIAAVMRSIAASIPRQWRKVGA